MVVVSLCCGFIGCKSNGGSWYKPSSYAWQNPFKNHGNFEDDEYGKYAEANQGTRLPKDRQTPDLTIPPDGYSSERTAQTANRSANVSAQQTGVGGYPQSQNTPVALNQGGTYQPNQSVNYTPQGQQGMQQNPQYPPNYGSPQGNMAGPNTNYQQSQGYQPAQGYPPQGTYNNPGPTYSPTNPPYQTQQMQQAQPQNDSSFSATNQGYGAGQSFYGDEYRPGR